jgi:serine/threonine protein kinase
MTSLNHPNLLKLYDCFWVQDQSRAFFVLIVEWCNKDLAKDLTQRRKSQYMWPEDQLFRLFTDLISALVYMQNYGVAHRDLKPENVFLSINGTVKIGDFGSAKWQAELLDFTTLRGTPLYLSPKLRTAMSKGEAMVSHNVYKSDVYSLGLTMVALMKMNFPVELASASTTDDYIQEVIDTLPYSGYWQEILRNMLWMDEDRRWDFRQIWNHLNPAVIPQTLVYNDVPTAIPQPAFPSLSPPSAPVSVPINDGYDGREECKIPLPTLCLHCKSPINKYSYTALCQIVQLYCNPQMHLFCSPDCFLAFTKGAMLPLRCPECHTDIDDDTYLFYKQHASTGQPFIDQDPSLSCAKSINSATQGSLQSTFCGWMRLFGFPCCQ